MCNPFALQAAAAVVGFAEKDAAAKEQNKRARESALNQYTQHLVAEQQEHQAASDKLMSESIKALEAQAEFEAAAETHSGSVVTSILRNMEGKAGHNKHNIETNYANSVQQRQYEMAGVQTSANGRLKRGPSPIALGLEIGNAYMETSGSYT